MADREFTPEQIETLYSNPNVASVKGSKIFYTLEFKEKFVKEYAGGKKPSRIFEDAGFDIQMLGVKRIERASARWRKSNNLGFMSDDIGYVEVHKDHQRNNTNEMDILRRLQKLEEEVKLLRNMQRKGE